jgi:hypothetical protein
MQVKDLCIGLLLMNGMPHYMLGVNKVKMMSGFGTGDTKNIIWALLNIGASVGLFLSEYGVEGLLSNQIYLGALLIVLIFIPGAFFWRRFFAQKETGK